MHAILTLHEKVRTGELTRRREDGAGRASMSPSSRVCRAGSSHSPELCTWGRRVEL